MTPPTKPESSAATSAARPFLRRLERLVLTLLGMKVDGADGLYKLQTDLLALQRDVQQAITAAKATPRSKAKSETLEVLRAALWETRRFGDAIAWVFLHMERQVIYPLADNNRVAVPPADDIWKGFETVVRHIGAQGLGFPLLHDVTDTLRVGDVTFIKPGEPPATAEVKTRIVESEQTDEGRKITYQVTAVWTGEDPPERVKAASSRPGEVPENSQPPPAPSPVGRQRPIKPQFGRQLQRMRKADMLRVADDGQITEHEDGRASITVMAPAYQGESHWKVLRRLAREARRDGYATATVEDAIMYVGMHRPDGFTTDDDMAPFSRAPSDLLASGILWTDPAERHRNGLAIFQIPEAWRRVSGPQLYMPYFLYPLQRWAILDLLHGRLVIMAVLNPGRLAAAVEAKGLEIELPQTERDWLQSPLTAFTPVELPDGSKYRVGVSGLHMPLMEMIQEAKPLDYFATHADAMANAAKQQFPDILARSAS